MSSLTLNMWLGLSAAQSPRIVWACVALSGHIMDVLGTTLKASCRRMSLAGRSFAAHATLRMLMLASKLCIMRSMPLQFMTLHGP